MNVFLDENLPPSLAPLLCRTDVQAYSIRKIMNAPGFSDPDCMKYIDANYAGQNNAFLTRDRNLTRRSWEITEWRGRNICLVMLSGKISNMGVDDLFIVIPALWDGICQHLLSNPRPGFILVNERGIKKTR